MMSRVSRFRLGEYRNFMLQSSFQKICSVLLFMVIACALQARPLNIIIVTSDNSAEAGYSEFLREIFMDNAEVEIDANHYDEDLSDSKKQQLAQADLIIISSDNAGGDYNGDSAFWAALPVPILSHNTSLCRSNNHDNWDWISSDRITIPISQFYATDPNDSLFDGIDLASGGLSIFDSPKSFLVPDEPYVGNGLCLATDSSGLPVIVYFSGSENSYYSGSLYDPNDTPRIFFAMPDEPTVFFENATEPAKQLLRNAVTTLLNECWLIGDIDCDRDVDMEDLAELSEQWLQKALSESSPLTADIAPDGSVDENDFALLAEFWLEGLDITAPLPDPVSL